MSQTKVVPLEPTEEMVMAGTNQFAKDYEADRPTPICVLNIFTAMLAAAPKRAGGERWTDKPVVQEAAAPGGEGTAGQLDADGFRICEFCKCRTNAKLRACCDKGKAADKLAAKSDVPAAPSAGELVRRLQARCDSWARSGNAGRSNEAAECRQIVSDWFTTHIEQSRSAELSDAEIDELHGKITHWMAYYETSHDLQDMLAVSKLCAQAKANAPRSAEVAAKAVAEVISLTEARMLIINAAPIGTKLYRIDAASELPSMELHESFGDPKTLLNSRAWLQSALEAKGAKRTGGGIGLGQADLDIELEGQQFNVSIRPLVRGEA